MESVVAASVLAKMDSLIFNLVHHGPFLTLFLPSKYWVFVLMLKLEFAFNGLELFMYGMDWHDIFKDIWKPFLMAFVFLEILSYFCINNYPESRRTWLAYLLFFYVIWFSCVNALADPLHRRYVLIIGLIFESLVAPFGEFILDIYVSVCGMMHFYKAYRDNIWKLYLFCFMTFYSLWFTELALLSKFDAVYVILYSIAILSIFILALPTRYRCRFYQIYFILAMRVIYAMVIAIYNSEGSLLSSFPAIKNITRIIEEMAERKRNSLKSY